jgi:hypothetical protein
LWFAAEEGITRYRRSAIPAFTVGQRVTIEYSSIDFKTVPEKRQYRYRIKEVDSAWRKPTKATSFDYTFEEAGTYTFEAQAIDRDLNYSQPASLTLKVTPHPYLEELRQTREELEAAYRDLKARNAELQVAKEVAEVADPSLRSGHQKHFPRKHEPRNTHAADGQDSRRSELHAARNRRPSKNREALRPRRPIA